MHLVFLQKNLLLNKLLLPLMQDLWARTLGEVEMEVSKAVFLTLFKPTSLISLEDGTATISAPSMMIIDLLQRRFYSLIKTSLDKQVSMDTTLVFITKVPTARQEIAGPLFEKTSPGKSSVGHLPRVRADYTFENLAVSESNRLAFAAAQAVSKKTGYFYNPLFIHGPVGAGKTHLMQAIANEIYHQNPDKKILYMTSEDFTNDVVDAIRTNSTSSMKRKFRNLDVLLIDDVQFLAGKEKVQEELFHTFNCLVDNSSQIILSSDRQPAELRGIEKRIVSRFSGGLTVDIEAPDFELRCAILLIKAKKLGISLSMDCAKTIAQEIKDTRALEGTLLKLTTQAESLGQSLSLELVKKAVVSETYRPKISPDDIIRDVCLYYKIRPAQIKGQRRDSFLVRPRQVVMYLLKKEFGLTFSEIGNLLGGRDHTTIMHGVNKIEGLVLEDKLPVDLLGISKSFSPALAD